MDLSTTQAPLFDLEGYLNLKRHLEKEGTPLIKFSENLPTIKQLRRLLIAEAMRRTNFNRTVAARMLGISRQALSKHLKNKNLNSDLLV